MVRVRILKNCVRMSDDRFPQVLSVGDELDWDATDAQRAAKHGLLEIIDKAQARK